MGHYLLQKNFLYKEGWNRTVRTQKPVDVKGNPLPWFSYACITFLNDRIRQGMSVFEYGSGNSTLWFLGKGCNLVSVEHHKGWYDTMFKKIGDNPAVEYLWRDLESKDYSMEILNHKSKFDIVVIDGRDRVNCSLNALGALKENGVIIWDNADRPAYAEGYKFLMDNGFKRLDFHGMGPINSKMWTTSIFYKSDNCLKL